MAHDYWILVVHKLSQEAGTEFIKEANKEMGSSSSLGPTEAICISQWCES